MICMLTRKYNIEHKESDATSMALILKQLVDFDSPRYLIQEVASAS